MQIRQRQRPQEQSGEALRQSKQGMVVVLHRDHPDAVMKGRSIQGGLLRQPGVRTATGSTALFRDGEALPGSRRPGRRDGQAPSSPISRGWGIPVIRLTEAGNQRRPDTWRHGCQSSSSDAASDRPRNRVGTGSVG